MIIGTHNDVARLNEDDISEKIRNMYSDNSCFPEIADVCCISNMQRSFKDLRNRIYSIATHLFYDGKNQC